MLPYTLFVSHEYRNNDTLSDRNLSTEKYDFN